jgi:hypothetical protein
MTLFERIEQDFKNAYKAKQDAAVSTLRMLKAALKNRQIELMHPLTEEEALGVVKSQLKQLAEALETAVTAGRTDLAEKAKTETLLLEGYLPSQMTDAELEAVVRDAVQASGAASKADFGKAMGSAMKAVAGRADGKRVQVIVQKMLPIVAGVLVGMAVASDTHAATALPGFDAFPMLLRTLRVFIMLLGIVCVNMILVGSYKYMIASGNDDEYTSALRSVGMGIMGTIFLAGIFLVLTVRLGTS